MGVCAEGIGMGPDTSHEPSGLMCKSAQLCEGNCCCHLSLEFEICHQRTLQGVKVRSSMQRHGIDDYSRAPREWQRFWIRWKVRETSVTLRKKKKQNTCLFNQFTSIFTVLNAIIQLCSRANLSHTRPQIVPPVLAARLQARRQPSAPQTITR